MAVAVTSDPAAPPGPRRRSRVPAGLLVPGLALLVLAVGCWAMWGVTIDDAFITFRYSAHLAAGLGPVWNVGQDPVEGYTNFAWMAWNALFALVGADLATVSKVTSAVLAAAVVVQLWRATGTRAGAVTALGCFVLFLPTPLHVAAGLETTAIAAVLLRATVLGVRVLRGGAVRAWEPPLLVLLAGTLRPEGALATLPVLLVWLWSRRRSAPELAWTAVAAVVGVGYVAWRWSYFGQPLPNTFYIKFGNLASGRTWIDTTVTALLPLLVLAVLLLVRRPRGPGALIVVTVLLTYLPYAVSGPSMDYVHRFAFHAYPVLCLAAGLLVDRIAGRRLLAAATAAVAVGWVLVAGVTTKDVPTLVNYGADLNRAHAAIGRGLAASGVPPAERSVAVSDAGAIPYLSDWTATDYIGLNDEQITAGATPQQVVDRADPTVVVVTGSSPTPPVSAYGLDVRRTATSRVLTNVVPMRANYYQFVYVKRPQAARVGQAVGAAVAAAQRADPEGYDLTIGRWLDRLAAGR